MKRSQYCVWGALVLALGGCKDQPSANQAQPSANQALSSANQAEQVAKKAQLTAKGADAKCPHPYTILPPGTPALTRRVYACVERHALLYAKGPDSPESLSKAVIAKCKETLVQYVDEEAKKARVKPPYKEAFESWQAHTLPIIAEARARGCYSN